MPILRAALHYFLPIFALAFVLGTARTIWIAPLLGEGWAVLGELPLVLIASWWWASRLVKRRPLPSRSAALAMGLIAFTLLIAAELGLAVVAFGQSPGAWLAGLSRPLGLLGLSGQAVFGLIPALVWRRR